MKKLILSLTFLSVAIVFMVMENPMRNLDDTATSRLSVAEVSSNSSGQMPQEDWLQQVQRRISEQEYDIHPQKGGEFYTSPNRRNNLRITYFEDGFAIKPRVDSLEKWNVDFQVLGLQRGEDQVFCLEGSPAIEVEGNRMLQHFDEGFHIEYKNTAEGMRQNFYVEKKPNGNGSLRLRLQTSGGLFPIQNGEDAVNLVEGGSCIGKMETKATYADLKVFDADGFEIPARMEVAEPQLDEASGEWIAGIDLVVDDFQASYPLLIDPDIAIPVIGSDSAGWEGNQVGAYLGNSVSSAGDVNGDGYSDVVIGAFGFDFGLGDEGAAFVFHGSPLGLDSTAATILQGNQSGDQFGWSVSTAGDVNADGYSDIIVGANFASAGQPQEGLAFVYKGSSNGVGITGTLLQSGQNGANFGYTVASAGDVDNDGYSDVVVGAPNYDNGLVDIGAIFVFHGSAQGIDPLVGARIEGIQAFEDLGYSVACAGDVNGDGYCDLIAGASGYDLGQIDEGAAFIYHGTPGGINPAAMAVLQCNQASASMGVSVASAGDVNGDGYSDVIIGANQFSNPELNEGVAFMFLGSSNGIVSIIDTILESNQAGAEFGFSVASAGDMNGDGYSDVIVGAKSYDTQNGAAFLYTGAATGVDGTSFTQLQPSTLNAQFGYSVAPAGDVNGDGYSDVLVGAPFYSNVESNEGGAFIYHGAPNGCAEVAGATLTNSQNGSQMGRCVNSAGDVNGDGFGDVIVSAPNYTNMQSQEGAAYIYHGSAMGLSANPAAIVESNVASGALGGAASSAGDVNGDGYSDIVVRSYSFSQGGDLFVYHGSSLGIDTTVQIVLRPDFDIMGYFDWVAPAGDVNGDGFGDIVAAASIFGSGQNDEPAAVVYLGSSDGIVPSPVTLFESNYGNIGYVFCSSAGDVNGDGYSDVIIGAPDCSFDQSNEGVAWVILGSECGLDLNSVSLIDGDTSYAGFGCAVASAGDINGDGFSDVIVGSNAYSNLENNEGAVYLFLGSPNGIDSIPSTVIESNVSNMEFGKSVASAGDVNGDGYGDIIVGTTLLDSSFIYLGSPTGITPSPNMKLHDNGSFGSFGGSVASAGDVNGDGYSEVIVGAPIYGGTGGAFVYYGNGGNGLTTKPEQFRAGSSTTIAPGGLSGASGQVALSMIGKSFIGRQEGKLVWELAPNGQPFSSAGGKITNSVDSSGASTAYTNMFGTGTTIAENLSGLLPATDYKWRARIKYDPSTAITGQMYGPWFCYKSRTPEVPMLGFKTEAFPTPEITILGNSQAILDGDTVPSISDSTDFGTIADCGDTLVRTYTIQNNGNKVLNLASVAISGVNMQEFTLSPPQSTTISAGNSTSFQVTFDPAAIGIRSAVVTIFTDDCDEAAFEFAIQGTGGPDITPPKFDTCIANRIIPLSQSCVGIIPDYADSVSVSDNCSSTSILQPGSWAPGTVLSDVDSSYAITLYAQDGNGNLDTCTFSLAISGYALQVLGNGDSIYNGDLSPAFQDSTDFWNLASCKDSTIRQFTITNPGDASIVIDQVRLSGPDSADFRILFQNPQTVGAGNSINFDVVFEPIGGGLREAIVNVYANGCTAHPYQFAIQGNVLAPIIPDIFESYGEIATTIPFLAYQWWRDGLILPPQTGPTIIPLLPGDYFVFALDTNGCNNESNHWNFDPNANQVNRQLFVSYPNPLQSDYVHFQLLDSSAIGSKVTIRILNGNGQEMIRQEVESLSEVTSINVSNLQNGYYQLVLELVGKPEEMTTFLKL
jgi:FG-GAP repeat/Secretion system C-terminal sorting domain